MNNLSYSIILSFSADLAKEFNEEKLMSSFSGSMVFLSVFGRIAYSKYGLKFTHQSKIWKVIFIWVAGIVFLFCAKIFSRFSFVIVGCLLIGLGTSLGAMVVIGFIKCFPSSVFSGFSAGTGFSGILGAVLYLLMKIYNFSFDSILFVMFFFYPLFGIAFMYIIKIKFQILKLSGNSQVFSDVEDDSAPNENIDFETMQNNEAQINQELNIENSKHVVKAIWVLIFGFFLVYIGEYVAITELAEKIKIKYVFVDSEKDILFVKTKHIFFEIIQLMYQIGIFLARSSLDFFIIRKIYYVILVLFIVNIFIVTQIYYFVTLGSFVVFISFFLVGLMGGFGYSNLYYLTLDSPHLEKKFKVSRHSVFNIRNWESFS